MKRNKNIKSLIQEDVDLIIIGGGITGAGIALDTALRGMKTVLFEKDDFASGTSSRSTKLVHGGLRYLKQMEFKLVNEVGRERAVLHQLAPHLVHPDKMLLPLIKGGNYGYWLTSMGLSVYDFLAGVTGEDRRLMLNAEETKEAEPLLRDDILEGGGLYAEYRTDDARLVMSVIRSAIAEGVKAFNYMKVASLVIDGERAVGVEVEDQLTNEAVQVNAKCIVNATGPWVDDVRTLGEQISGKRLHLTKGIHLVIPHEKLPIKQTVYFDHADRRMIFAIPRGITTYLGTTDTFFEGDKSNPGISQEDVTYILDAVNNMFPSANLSTADIISSWSGLRPLIHEEGKTASAISRKDELFFSENGMISIAGGKLTGYRKMAERVVDQVAERIGNDEPCSTEDHQLTGGQFENYRAVKEYIDSLSKQFSKFNVVGHEIQHLVHTYGDESEGILMAATKREETPEQALLFAQFDFSIANEQVCTLADFVERRTGMINFEIEKVKRNSSDLVNYAAKVWEWDEERKRIELQKLNELVAQATDFSTT
ncbi:MAG: glycerol-3-phosphate dehydrogenase/oxidase [Flavobacteriales bacterium]|nr:glycerol-3-phosphate dehydrogenase/oxidase [Flavobacteriales bacterium]